jgi:ubiquinone/menaquinone biosynthesis C-methylase UbiE
MGLKINLGSGRKRIDGFLNVDGDINVSPDYLVDLEKDKLPFEDSSVSEIVAEHILEHITNFIPLMKEIYRVCEDGALVKIRVPNPRHDIFLADPTHVRPILAESFRLFSLKHNNNQIETGGSSSCLAIQHGVDFELVSQDYVIDPFYQSFVQNSKPEEVIQREREVNNFILENVYVLQVLKDA